MDRNGEWDPPDVPPSVPIEAAMLDVLDRIERRDDRGVRTGLYELDEIYSPAR